MQNADKPDGGQARCTMPVHTPGEPLGGSLILAELSVHAHYEMLDWILHILLQEV